MKKTEYNKIPSLTVKRSKKSSKPAPGVDF